MSLFWMLIKNLVAHATLDYNSIGQSVRSLEVRRIACIHEMLPTPNQGGNVRLFEFMRVLIREGLKPDLYIRRNIPTDTNFVIGGATVSVFADNMQLKRFASQSSLYGIVISTMWFWNMYSPGELTIPLVVHGIQNSMRNKFIHIVDTVDIHSERSHQTIKHGVDESFRDNHRQELRVWCLPETLKVFVTEQDMNYAMKKCVHVGRFNETFTFIPFILRNDPNKAFSKRMKSAQRRLMRYPKDRFNLVIFGITHPGNQRAYEMYLPTIFNKDNLWSQHSTLRIFGDRRWRKEPVVMSLIAQGFDVRVEGEVDSLDEHMHTADLLLAPSITKSTGISSKIFKSIELQLPFVTTANAITGFPCDAECMTLFVASGGRNFNDVVLKLLFDRKQYLRAVTKLRDISFSLRSKELSTNIKLNSFIRCKGDIALQRSVTEREKPPAQHRPFTCTVYPQRSLAIQECNFAPKSSIVLSVYVSLLGNEREKVYVSSYTKDVAMQDFTLPWELVIASADASVLSHFRTRMMKSLRQRGANKHLSVRTVLLRADRGLYETWDLLIQKFTSGVFLTNWNVDDRKHRSALSIKTTLLQSNPDIDVVSSAVYVSHVDNEDWNACHRLKRPIWHSQSGPYSASSFVKTKPGGGAYLEPQNYPHNTPVYRRSVHGDHGYFANCLGTSLKPAPACCDWKFWYSVAIKGGVFFNIEMPFEVYLARTDSHNRRSDTNGSSCVSEALNELKSYGLYNNLHFWSWRQDLLHDMRKNIVIVTQLEVRDQPVELLHFLTWLHLNEHSLFLLQGNNPSVKSLHDSLFTKEKHMTSMLARTVAPPTADIILWLSKVELEPLSSFEELFLSHAQKIGISDDTCELGCDKVLMLSGRAETSQASRSKKFQHIGNTPESWIQSWTLMHILHPLLTRQI